MITGSIISAGIYENGETAKIVNIELKPGAAKHDPTIYGFSYAQGKEETVQIIRGDAKEIKRGRLRKGTTK